MNEEERAQFLKEIQALSDEELDKRELLELEKTVLENDKKLYEREIHEKYEAFLNYKLPKEERKLTPQEQDLEDIKAMGNPKFKFDFDDPKFAKLSPAVKTIYKDRFEHLVKGLDKELIVELPKTTAGKMSMKTIPTPETIRYNPEVIVPIMSRKEIDTVDQVEKIQELRKVRDQF